MQRGGGGGASRGGRDGPEFLLGHTALIAGPLSIAINQRRIGEDEALAHQQDGDAPGASSSRARAGDLRGGF